MEPTELTARALNCEISSCSARPTFFEFRKSLQVLATERFGSSSLSSSSTWAAFTRRFILFLCRSLTLSLDRSSFFFCHLSSALLSLLDAFASSV